MSVLRLALLFTLSLSLTLLACGERKEDTGPEGDADTDVDADTDADTDATLCGQVTLLDEHCSLPSTVNAWTVLEGMDACDDDAIFNDSGIGSSWVDWRDELAAEPDVGEDGSFGASLEAGDYAVRHFNACYGCAAVAVSGDGCTDVELELYVPAYADAPNVYLYPPEPSMVRVRLPAPELLTDTDPAYPDDGWWALAQPDGSLLTAEGPRDFLFYELLLPDDRLVGDLGWCVDGRHAQASIEAAMELYGFLDNEIEDFAEFWDPNFPEARRFTVLPVTSELPWLGISPRPDHLLRAWFMVLPGCRAVAQPLIEPVPRSGYHAAEWGVVLDAGLGRPWMSVE